MKPTSPRHVDDAFFGLLDRHLAIIREAAGERDWSRVWAAVGNLRDLAAEWRAWCDNEQKNS